MIYSFKQTQYYNLNRILRYYNICQSNCSRSKSHFSQKFLMPPEIFFLIYQHKPKHLPKLALVYIQSSVWTSQGKGSLYPFITKDLVLELDAQLVVEKIHFPIDKNGNFFNDNTQCWPFFISKCCADLIQRLCVLNLKDFLYQL